MPECQSRDAQEISSAIQEWLREQSSHLGFQIKPYQVNCGMCDELAQFVEARVRGSEMVCIEDEFPELAHISHYAVRFKGRYYDSEAPCGVDDVRDLPVIRHAGDVEYHKKMKDSCDWI